MSDTRVHLNHARQLALARQLIARLERLSADSYWAHQASGVRGALLRSMVQLEERRDRSKPDRLGSLIARGFYILEQAARELERKT